MFNEISYFSVIWEHDILKELVFQNVNDACKLHLANARCDELPPVKAIVAYWLKS